MDLDGEVSERFAGRTAETESSRTAVPADLAAKQQKSKEGNSSALKRESTLLDCHFQPAQNHFLPIKKVSFIK